MAWQVMSIPLLLVSSSHSEVGPAVDNVVDKNDGHDGHDVHADDSITTTTNTTTHTNTNTATTNQNENKNNRKNTIATRMILKLLGRIMMVQLLLFTLLASWSLFKRYHPTQNCYHHGIVIADGHDLDVSTSTNTTRTTATTNNNNVNNWTTKNMMMNQGGLPYTISNAPNYDTEQLSQRYQYFDVYSLPIQSLYSQVHWTSHGSIPLPLHIIRRFQNGTVMALMGYEVDQVRNDPITGQEVSVPITWTYNHHYMAVRKVTTVLPVVGTVIR
jgi:hypothetical protein